MYICDAYRHCNNPWNWWMNADSLKEKMESFWPKKFSHSMVELKFDPRFRVIGEYYSQIDYVSSVNLYYETIVCFSGCIYSWILKARASLTLCCMRSFFVGFWDIA